MSSRVFRSGHRLCLFAFAAERRHHPLARSIVVLSVALPLMAGGELFAESVSRRMNVSVQVVARAVLSVDPIATINVTSVDVARGFVDLPVPIRLTTRTNSRAGYLVTATLCGDSFSRIELSSAGMSLTVHAADAWLQRPYVAGGDSLALHARLWLRPGTAAGAYGFPVAFRASPL